MVLALAVPAFAGPGCNGKLNQFGNVFGLTPSDAAKNSKLDFENAGEWEQALRDGTAWYEVGPKGEEVKIDCSDF